MIIKIIKIIMIKEMHAKNLNDEYIISITRKKLNTKIYVVLLLLKIIIQINLLII